MTTTHLVELSKAIDTARDAVDTAIAARDAAIIQAARDQIPKTDVCEATGLTKEQVRRIERAGSAPKRAAGRPKQT